MKYSLIATLVSAAMLMACQAQSQHSAAVDPAAAVYAELTTTLGQFQSSANALVWQDGKGAVIQQWHGVFRRLKALPQTDGSVLLAAIETESNQLHWWQLQGKTVQRSGKQLVSQLVVDDLCWYQSAENKQLSLFLIGDRGLGEQWLLAQDSSFLAAPLSIRNLNLPTDATACAVDQQKGTLYLAEGATALWSYNAEVEADEGRTLIDVQAPLGKLTGEVKALEFTANNSLVALQEEPALLQSYQTQGDSLVWQQSKAITALESAEQLGLSAGILSVVSEEGQHTQLNDKAYQAQAAVLPERSSLPMQQLSPTLETVAVSYRGDAIDDPAVWQHATNPDNSRILATDKRAGVAVYNMKGEQLQFLNVGRVNNIDLRYGLEYQGKKQDIAAATLRADNSVQLFAIDAQGLVKTAVKFATPLTDIYGLCLYQSKRSGQTYVFANDKDGTMLQYQISSNGQSWSAKEVRRLKVPSQPEGCVADDQNDVLFLGEEDVGVWRFAADAKADTKGELVIKADGDVLVADVEGLALLPGKAGKPAYLLASSQGNDSYVLFQTTAPYKAVARFRIRLNAELGIDGSSETDGLELTTLSLGKGFEQGAVIVQDGRNRMPEQGQNLKLVPLEQVLELLPTQ